MAGGNPEKCLDMFRIGLLYSPSFQSFIRSLTGNHNAIMSARKVYSECPIPGWLATRAFLRGTKNFLTFSPSSGSQAWLQCSDLHQHDRLFSFLHRQQYLNGQSVFPQEFKFNQAVLYFTRETRKFVSFLLVSRVF